MKIVHMADSHLGYAAYGRSDPQGRNLREEQIYKGFSEAVENILEINPDAVVHAGDVFHHVRPKIKPLYIFKQALDKLRDAEIPVIIISGNHDSPKSYAAISPFYIYEGLDKLHIAHTYRYERFEVGDHLFHCIPFCLSPLDYIGEFSKIEYSGRDVLVMHGLVEALSNQRLKTVGEHELKSSLLKSDFSYIALGHYHGQTQVAKNAWYSGSIDYLNFGEAQQIKGMLLVDLDRGSVESLPIKERYMIDHPWIDCTGFSSQDLMKAIESICDENDIRDKIVRIKLMNVSKEAYKNIDHRWLTRLGSEAIYLKIMPAFIDGRAFAYKDTFDLKNLSDEFDSFLGEEISSGRIPEAIQNEVADYGKEMIHKIISIRATEVFDAPK